MLLTYGTFGFWGVLGTGLAAGVFGGLLLGRWLTLLLLRNPLRLLFRAYAELWRDVVHLVATGQLRAGR